MNNRNLLFVPIMVALVLGFVLPAMAGYNNGDFDRRMRQEQDEVRKRMEGSNTNSWDKPKPHVYTYDDPGARSIFSNASRAPVAAPMPVQSSYAPQAMPVWTPPPLPPIRTFVKKAPKKAATKAKKSTGSSGSTKGSSSGASASSTADLGKITNLDGVKESGTISGAGSFSMDSVMRAAIIGGFFGGLAGLIGWAITLVVSAGSPTSRMQNQKVIPIAMMAITLPLVHTWSNSPSFDSSKIPILNKLVSPIPVSGGTKTFERVGSDTFMCSINIPKPYKIQRQDIMGMWVTTVTYEEKDGAFMMCYARLPQDIVSDSRFNVQFALDNSCKSSVAAIHGVTTYKTDIVLDGLCPGREVEGKVPDKNGMFRQRVYISNGNFYQTAVIGIRDVVDSRDAYEFLDSFHISRE